MASIRVLYRYTTLSQVIAGFDSLVTGKNRVLRIRGTGDHQSKALSLGFPLVPLAGARDHT